MLRRCDEARQIAPMLYIPKYNTCVVVARPYWYTANQERLRGLVVSRSVTPMVMSGSCSLLTSLYCAWQEACSAKKRCSFVPRERNHTTKRHVKRAANELLIFNQHSLFFRDLDYPEDHYYCLLLRIKNDTGAIRRTKQSSQKSDKILRTSCSAAFHCPHLDTALHP